MRTSKTARGPQNGRLGLERGLPLNKFFEITPSMRKVDDGEKKRKKKEKKEKKKKKRKKEVTYHSIQFRTYNPALIYSSFYFNEN